MLSNRKHSNEKLVVAAIWFLVILCGTAYSAVNYDAPFVGVDAPRGTVSPVMRDALKKIIAQGAAGDAAEVAGKVVDDTLYGDIGNMHEIGGKVDQLRSLDRHVGVDVRVTQQGSSAVSDTIKARQAAEQLYAASDDLINGLSASVINYYINMTPEQAVAALVAEATELGYISDGAKISQNSLSLISKAYAAVTTTDSSPGLTGGPGVAARLKLRDKYGGGCASPPQTPQEKHGCGVLMGLKAEFVEDIVEQNYEYPGSGPDRAKAKKLATTHKAGVPFTKGVHELFDNGVVSGGGGGGVGDNSDHSSFFISSAYAKSDNGPVSKLADTAYQASGQACTTAAAVNEGKDTCGMNQNHASPLQVAHFGDTAMCNSVDKHAALANDALADRKDPVKNMQDGCRKMPGQWVSTYH
jgi:hypothetical protein